MFKIHNRITNIQPASHKLKNQKHFTVEQFFDDTILTSRDWKEFSQSWNYLELDKFMSDGGKYRYRRYSVYEWKSKTAELVLLPHEPHFQLLNYNKVNGGVLRNFEPFTEEFKSNLCFQLILKNATALFSNCEPGVDWHIEAHQSRIAPNPDQKGMPTPEGVHCDGRDFVFIMLVDRENINGGVTTLYNGQFKEVSKFEMRKPSGSIFLNDRAMFHGVSSVERADKNKPAYRDILVVTYVDKRKSQLFSESSSKVEVENHEVAEGVV